MRSSNILAALALAVPLAIGCGSAGGSNPDTGDTTDVDPDGGDVTPDGDTGDGGPDGDTPLTDGDVGDDAGDVPDVPPTVKTVVTVTSGGGTVTSPTHRLTLSVGTPQPMGSASSGTHTVTVGPGAVQNQ